jgi:putative ABC transport system permease protein
LGDWKNPETGKMRTIMAIGFNPSTPILDLPGFAISFGLYGLTKTATGLPMVMQLSRAIMVLILTIIMCFCSGAISTRSALRCAVRKLQDADPADIF